MTYSNRSYFVKRLMAGLLSTCLLLSGCGSHGSKESQAEPAPVESAETEAESGPEEEEDLQPEEGGWEKAYDAQKDAALIALLDRLYAPSAGVYV